MSSDDGDNKVRRGDASGDFSGEGRCSDDIEGGYTKEFFGIEDILGFEDFGDDGNGRVDGVRDDEDESIGTG